MVKIGPLLQLSIAIQYPDIDFCKNHVEKVVKSCKEYSSIDPSAINWEPGHLDEIMTKFGKDLHVTQYGSAKYLTVMNCSLSRFSIWYWILNVKRRTNFQNFD